jgi:hypothetical protein
MYCLVCGAEAQQIPIITDGATIFCPMCGEYDVESMVVATGLMQKLGMEERADVLDKARRSAETGARPLITRYLLA